MGASSATQLRNWEIRLPREKWTYFFYYGLCAFNYVAQPEDGVTALFPRIGDYDKWAIKWGYSYFEDTNEAQEKPCWMKWLRSLHKNNRLWFGSETSPYDPRYQTEDIGDNAMRVWYGIKKKNFYLILEWSKEDGESYAELDELYGALTGQFRRYMGCY
jgi:hypothetical protein